MLPIIQIAGLTLRTPGLALLAGLWLGLEVSSREGMRRGISGDRLYNVAFYSLIAGVLGTRLAFVVTHLSLYTGITPWLRAVLSIASLTPGTEIGWAGVLIGLGVAAYFTHRWNLAPLDLADALAPGVGIVAIGVGLANLLSGEVYGIETNLPWGIPMWGTTRHPTQIYFMLVAGGAVFAALRLRSSDVDIRKRSGKAKKHWKEGTAQRDTPAGSVMQVVLIILSAGILFIEPLRADSPVIGDGVRVWLIVAVAVITAMMGMFAFLAPARVEKNAL